MGLKLPDTPLTESSPSVQSIAQPSTPTPTPTPPLKSPTEKPTTPTATPKSEQKPEKKSAGELASVLLAARKAKGEGIAVTGRNIPQVKRIPTGIFEFDLAVGGGFPRSRYSIVYGPESSGKTNLTYKAIANAQKLPPPCNKAVLIDLEGTFDPVWAEQFGIDVDELVVIKPGYGEEAGDLCEAVLRAEDVAIVVLDSLAVMVSSKEAEQSLEKFDVGTSGLLVKRLVNKIVIALSEEAKRGHEPAMVFINQTRMKIGVMFGNPETMPGGQAMKFLSALTVRLNGKNKTVNSVSPDMPAFKETTAEIKKAKVPVTRYNFNYDLVLYPHEGLSVGDTNSWGLVSNSLKQIGALVKATKGWELLGKTYPTLTVIEDTYQAESSFALKLQEMVIDSYKGKFILIHGDD